MTKPRPTRRRARRDADAASSAAVDLPVAGGADDSVLARVETGQTRGRRDMPPRVAQRSGRGIDRKLLNARSQSASEILSPGALGQRPDLKAALGSEAPANGEIGDSELMERLQRDDAEALEALLRRYWRPLVAFAVGFVREMDVAEDIVQETFIRVWQRRADWQPNGSVRSFVYRITRNLSLNEQRAREVRERWRTRGLKQHPQSPVTPAQHFEAEALEIAVQAAVEALPERRRQVFVLARYHNLSRHQIAAVMGISPQTVANQLSAALSTLRDALAPFIQD